MIIQERITIDGQEYIRTYSNSGRYVVGGSPEGEYPEAIDPVSAGRTYVEGGYIPSDESEANAEELLNIIIGEEI